MGPANHIYDPNRKTVTVVDNCKECGEAPPLCLCADLRDPAAAKSKEPKSPDKEFCRELRVLMESAELTGEQQFELKAKAMWLLVQLRRLESRAILDACFEAAEERELKALARAGEAEALAEANRR